MELLQLIDSHENPPFAYYRKGNTPVKGDDFVLLGFKNQKPVIERPVRMKPVNKCNDVTMPKRNPKMQVDTAGEKFIHLNGHKLKVVSQDKIPEEVRKRTLLLKNKMLNLGNIKKSVKLCVISSATQLTGNKADMKDKPVSNNMIDKLQCTAPKKLRVISIKNLIKPEHCDPSSESESSNSTIDLVNPENIQSDSQGLPEQIDSFIINNTSAKGTTKLLTSKNIDVLNMVKMQALNLSKKSQVIDSAVQTDPQLVMDQHIQTDIEDTFSLDGFCKWLQNDESPVVNNVNLNSTSKALGSTENLPYKVKTMVQNEDRKFKKQCFFRDLNECLKPTLSGNL